VVLEAAHRLRDDARIRFLIVGRGHGRDDLMRRAAQLGLPNLVFLPTQPRERLAEMLAAADVGLVTLDPRLSATSVPSKTFTLMAAGRPVLAAIHADNEVARMILAAECGAIAPPGGYAEIAAILRGWADDGSPLDAMGSRARSWAERFHGRTAAVQAHEEILSRESRPPRRHTGPSRLADRRPE
jgi:colanic acid biosynthesis glycosyl transferase WcaI